MWVNSILESVSGSIYGKIFSGDSMFGTWYYLLMLGLVMILWYKNSRWSSYHISHSFCNQEKCKYERGFHRLEEQRKNMAGFWPISLFVLFCLLKKKSEMVHYDRMIIEEFVHFFPRFFIHSFKRRIRNLDGMDNASGRLVHAPLRNAIRLKLTST